MYFLRSLILLLSLFFSVAIIHGQEMLGVTMGNYSGIAGTMVNPASMTTNKVFLDINIATADIFFRNNYAYLPKEDFIIYDLFDANYTFPTYGPDDKNLLIYENQKDKHINFNARILGPSAMLQIGNHGFGLSTGLRVFSSTNKVPYHVADFAYNGLEYTPLQNQDFTVKNMSFATNAWMEVGLSYAYDVWKYYDQQLTVGATVKRLWGYAGGYMNTSSTGYMVPNDTTIDIRNMNAYIGFSAPMDYDNMDFISAGPTFRGSGFGFDIGAVFVKKKEVSFNEWRGGRLCSQKYDEYIYKLGVSIVDIGSVSYATNAQQHSYDDISIYWVDVDTLGFDNLNSFLGEISNTFYGNPNASLTDNKIRIGLPTALSIQADVNLMKNVYLSGFFIHPIRFNLNSLRRPAQLAVTPRFETKYFEVSLPLSVYDYKYPRVGFSMRLYFITVGTERLGTYLGMADMNGMDIYASIKIGINKNSCRKKHGGACSNSDFGNKYF